MSKATLLNDETSLQLKELEHIYQLFLILEDELDKLKEKESKHFVQVGRTSFEESLSKTSFFNQINFRE